MLHGAGGLSPPGRGWVIDGSVLPLTFDLWQATSSPAPLRPGALKAFSSELVRYRKSWKEPAPRWHDGTGG